MLLQVQCLLSAPWPEGDDGQYYWIHGAYVNNSDFPNDSQMLLALNGDFRLLYTTQVILWSFRFKLPGTNTVYREDIYSASHTCFLPAQPNFNLLIAARWRLRGDDGSYSYHLHRQPTGEDYITSGQWSSLGLTQTLTRLSTFVSQDIYRTSTGSLITSGEVAKLPAMWQLRHGTKRRSRRFWLP